LSAQDRETMEARAEQCIRENRSEEALGLLYELISAYAGEKDFDKAESLYEKMYEADPMAIREIVRAGDVIEEAKKQGRDSEHLDIWSDLYQQLSAREGNALYYSMKTRDFDAGEEIMEQGEISNRLYFIHQGEVKGVFRRDSEEIHLITLGVGDIFGYEQFFSATVCTVSIIALSRVKTTFLEGDVIRKWKNNAPALESRLFDFSMQKDRVKKELEQSNLERRSFSRIPVSGKIVFQLLDNAGKSRSPVYKGEIADISAGGVSFLIKTSRPDSIRMLLGGRLRIKFDLVFKNGDRQTVNREGRVAAIQYQGFDDYSVHLKFDNPLDKAIIDRISPETAS